ncbi:MAG: hypothetical protein SFU21_08630 [Flavihumibacter sp.]|nr:hypothetical protein [Flavihumibacter sp.]
MSAGYAATTLAKKLGIKEGAAVKLVNAPADYFNLFTDWPANVTIITNSKTPADCIHLFVANTNELLKHLLPLKKQLKPAGMLWVSWYKKAAKIATDITEDVIRNQALANGLVDIKVCAVDEQWSGLKLVIPVKYRPAG